MAWRHQEIGSGINQVGQLGVKAQLQMAVLSSCFRRQNASLIAGSGLGPTSTMAGAALR